MDSRQVLTVSELNGSIRTLLESRFPFVSVAGEISNLHRPYSGHLYFTLKDPSAQIKAVLFKTQQRYLPEPPKDGMHVVCRGRISVYEPRGEYQLIVDTVDFHGTGALQLAFEQLKSRLAAEGLFDEHLKRTPPSLPRHITLVTSPQGAAVHDFIRIATRRYPPIRIAVYPVTVQGDRAAADMIQALADINAGQSTDVIVLCRGGGSIEDLWAFNDEQLARAIRNSRLPVVSAVGHEIDFTIADFAADLRAPTPSAAAELLVPDSLTLQRRIANCRTRLQRTMSNRIDRYQQRLLLARHHLETMPHPLDRLMLQVDQWSLSLELSIKTTLAAKAQRLARAAFLLEQRNPAHRLSLYALQLGSVQIRLVQAIRSLVQGKEELFSRATGVLQAVSPLATLARGYAIVRKIEGKKSVVTSETQVKVNERVEVILHSGELRCRVEAKEDDEGVRPCDQSRTASTS
ncbi:MAG: exodeoxyribonuclease VII large subunit [Desulfobulbaceae bacterium]|nr:exodeoxyribonuclease VII large subunit [Desulfobulbaceae bacterium]